MQKIPLSTGGIRTVYQNLNPLQAYDIILDFLADKKSDTVFVGYDGRKSCLPIYFMAKSAIIYSQTKCHDLGIVSTPIIAFLSYKYKKLGIQMTASHNPLKYVGIKLFNNGIEESQYLKNLKKHVSPNWYSFTNVVNSDNQCEYYKEIRNYVDVKSEFTIAGDFSGLCASTDAINSVKRFPNLKLISTNSNVPYPERELEPVEENLTNFINLCRSAKVDAGFAFDGDADRCRIILDNNLLTQEQQLLIFGHYMINKFKLKEIISTVESSTSLKYMCSKLKSKLKITKVGSANVSRELKNSESLFGAEPCGEYIFKEFHLAPDGIFLMLRFMEILENYGTEKIKDIIEKYDIYKVVRSKITVSNRDKVIEIISKKAKSMFDQIESVDTLDGIRINFKNNKGFVLIRKSGTEEILRITAESESIKEAEEMKKHVAEVVNSIETQI
ncbi:MAG: hypothetical protein N3E37_03765 [Candidatus Micrarchaeota archaeon]|nr:hypothetical protein [Candidatus Micrarchaeota archaeon]